MKRLITTAILLLSLSLTFPAKAQDLMDLLDADEEPTIEYTYATFKATRIVNGQSIENPPNGGLIFTISHHFGTLNSGGYELFGLDQANIRFGFEYGINDWLAVGVGRTSVNKVYDGSLKVKILRQSSGLRNMPISLSYWTNIAVTSLHWQEPERENYFSSRLQYAHQLLIARKFTPGFSLQITPTYIHRNLVETAEDQNDVFAIGAGGRVKLTNRLSVNAEYYYLLPGQTADDFYDSFSVGIDLETGGHVFQIYLTNSRGLIEEQFIAQTEGSWAKGDIHIGFNINRTFQLKKPKQDHQNP
jgi:opacity protein-like surface antigen